MIVELEADSQDRVRSFIIACAHFEKSLTEVSAQLKCRPDTFSSLVLNVIIQPLTKLPARLPCMFLFVVFGSRMKHPIPVNRAEAGEGIAEYPTFRKCTPQCLELFLCVLELPNCKT